MVGEVTSFEELKAIEEIKALKYAYLRCLDTKDWDGIAEVFTPEAVAAYSGGAYSAEGRDQIVAFLVRNMGSETFHSSHRCTHPEIRLEGDRATGTWALDDTVIDETLGILIQGAAFYEDTYLRRDGRWLIHRTGYKRSFEYLVPLSDLPNLSLTASWWGTGGSSTLPAG